MALLDKNSFNSVSRYTVLQDSINNLPSM